MNLSCCSIVLASSALEWSHHPTLERVFLESSCAQDSETMAYVVALTASCSDGQAVKLKVVLVDSYTSDEPDQNQVLNAAFMVKYMGGGKVLCAPEAIDNPSDRLCSFWMALYRRGVED